MAPPPPGFPAFQMPDLSPLLFGNGSVPSSHVVAPFSGVAPAIDQDTASDSGSSVGTLEAAFDGSRHAALADVAPPKGVSFREYVTVAYTWGGDEYDRTSTDVAPLRKEDLIELLLYRAEMQRFTRQLLQLRKEHVEANRRYAVYQEMMAIQAHRAAQYAYMDRGPMSPGSGFPTLSPGVYAPHNHYHHHHQNSAYFPPAQTYHGGYQAQSTNVMY
ncbi:hypothetical protein HKX48_000697 [Thoreauomyces humboldtii]|nr:hypothetical protein HKX48_000697 [Thoreauomyces humboldtii]